MNWVKCEHRLPETLDPVLVTGVMMNGKKTVWADVRYNADIGGWEVLADATGGYWVDAEFEITHWMAYPGPAGEPMKKGLSPVLCKSGNYSIHHHHFGCPICGHEVGGFLAIGSGQDDWTTHKDKYCSECGQKIDWSSTNWEAIYRC